MAAFGESHPPYVGADTVVVALPGTGSDADFAARAFAGTALTVIAIDPGGGGLISGYRKALDDAAAVRGPILAAGVSIGACVAVQWAIENPTSCAGVLAALPPWLGDPASAPAARSATLTLDLLRRRGLETTITQMAAGSPSWLADELSRSWRGTADRLESLLAEAAAYWAPTADMIARLQVPLAITAAVDDPVHPYEVARVWSESAPMSVLSEVTLADLGADPSVLGRTTISAWRAVIATGEL